MYECPNSKKSNQEKMWQIASGNAHHNIRLLTSPDFIVGSAVNNRKSIIMTQKSEEIQCTLFLEICKIMLEKKQKQKNCHNGDVDACYHADVGDGDDDGDDH